MIKIITIAGARPQFIKAAAISRAFRNLFPTQVNELIIHTGQHYDHNMSDVFFEELGIGEPAFRLGIGSSNHGKQTGEMLGAIEEVLVAEKPDAVIVYGDTNSTLAGALAASKLHIPVAHIEAGLRSFNKKMPEEINRILTDHVATWLFCPTQTALDNLFIEGFPRENTVSPSFDKPASYLCGDIMYDNSLYFAQVAAANHSDLLEKYGLEDDHFILATIHRNNNTDDPARLESIFNGIMEVSYRYAMKTIIPLHPRTRKMLEATVNASLWEAIQHDSLVQIIPPLSFLEVTLLESKARIILTDSGGVQKEAYFFKKPGIVLRPETEWVELVQQGTCLLADADTQRIIDAAEILLNKHDMNFPPLFGDGKAAEHIVSELVRSLSLNRD